MRHRGKSRVIGVMLTLFLMSAVPAAPAQAKQPGSGKTDVMNLLLIGQDKREGEDGNRSDSVILCSFHPETKKLLMTSVLRDLYVPIPGYRKNRINAAYAFGGAPLLKKTVEQAFGIAIDGTVEVDFEGFPRILDLLGGVELELRQDEADLINRKTGSDLQEGTVTLTGEQALVYSRIRSLDRDGDFSRTDRQRKILQAVWDSNKNSSLPTLLKVVGNLIPWIETDMRSGELLRAVVDVFPVLSEIDIVSHQIPQAGHCVDRMVDGMAVLVADLDAAGKDLRERIYGP